MTTPDLINHPPHYNFGKIEVIDFIDQIVAHYPAAVAYEVGSVLKYIARGPHKFDCLQDLQKAKWYLDRAVDLISNKRQEVGK